MKNLTISITDDLYEKLKSKKEEIKEILKDFAEKHYYKTLEDLQKNCWYIDKYGVKIFDDNLFNQLRKKYKL